MSTDKFLDSVSTRKKSTTRDSDPIDEKMIRNLIRKRGIIKGRLTKFSTYLSSFENVQLSPQNRIDLKLRVQGAADMFKEYNEIQSELDINVRECDLDEQLTQRDMFEEQYYKIVSKADLMLSGEVAASSSTRKINTIKLPTISIPSFDGSYENWLEFRDTFSSLIHNSTEICDIEKFHYLKSSLKGSAKLVIESLEFSAKNYAVAWDLLLNRYNNSRLLVHNHVKSLFSLPVLSRESHSLIRNLIDTILKNLRALKILGEPTEFWDTLIIFIIVSKLDKTTEREWEQFKGTLLSSSEPGQILKVSHIIQFLQNRADMLETLLVSHAKDEKPGSVPNKSTYNTKPAVTSSHCYVSTAKPSSSGQAQSRKGCLMCNTFHPLYACQKFLDLDLNARLQFVKSNKLCTNCLRTGHALVDCRFGPCRKCDIKHNSLLHTEQTMNPSITLHSSSTTDTECLSENKLKATVPISAKDNSSSSIFTYSQCTNYNGSSHVLLSTALIEVTDRYGNSHTARAMLDNGSMRCIISQELCDKLGTQTIQSTHEIRGVGGSVSQCTQVCDIDIKSRFNTYSSRIRCFVLSHMTSPLPAVCEPRASFCIPDHIQLADPHFLETKPIDLLIGADVFWDLLNDDKIRLPNGPVLQSTKLGWILSGPINHKARNDGPIQCYFTQSLDSQLRRFWELEELPKEHDTRTEEQLACEEHFVQTTKRNDEGRFIVSMPLKQSANSLGETYFQAENRFLALEKRLQRSPNYKSLYSDFIHEYEKLGHMTRVTTYSSPNYFLPHHGVFREQSTTTKLRVVFDASAASSTGKSLNDLQSIGAPIQGDLFAILLRFRQYKYVAIADIEKMYRQVLIDQQQRDLQLILWRDAPSQPISIFQLNTVTYGTASAPFLSVRCLKQLAADCTNPAVKQIINDDFYVDDMITGLDDKAKLLQLCNETSQILNRGCFPLRKWMFNFKCDDMSNGENKLKPLSMGDNVQSKTLGIGWSHSTDMFNFNTQLKLNNEIVTKRKILSDVSQIFDPLGILSPTIIIAKVLLQQLWLLKLDWDDEVPSDIARKWDRFVNSLSILYSIQVPRHVLGSNKRYLEMHIFTDASQTAYGACIYIRTTNDNGSVVVKLLCSKGKVAPLKPVSIPRLELCGALLGARLYHKVINSLRCKFDHITFWTDSTIVLGWLRMAPNLLKTFVQNRTAEIHELTKDHSWRHVSGKDNPADLVSRGLGLDELSKSNLWWEGPCFLHEPEFTVENHPIDTDSFELPELKQGVTSFIATTTDESCNSWFPFNRFSQFPRLIRTVAYMKRFIHNTRNKNNLLSGGLNVEELRKSEITIVRIMQSEAFPDEYKQLSHHKTLHCKKRLSSLNLFIDKDEIMRVGGRLDNSCEFGYKKKHPILLSSKHHIAILLFRHEHTILFHAGPQALLYHVRESWWPIGGRNLARKIVHDCVICKRIRGKTLCPLMGNLPQERITPTFPFNRCAVDYAGPILTLNRKGRGSKTIKSYICIFICFVTRAVHIELVSDLTTAAYYLALKRFISRRGKPSEIYSDNGRNFVGLMNEFKLFLENCNANIIEFANSQQIKFKMFPPFSAHFSGLVESGVRACKFHLRRVVGNAHLTFEELTTVLTQVEAIMNSRPLSPLSPNADDLLPLTPAHFLVGRPLTSPVTEDLQDTPTHRLTRYQHLEKIRQHFWTRWSKEYISELQLRKKWRDNNAELKPDTLVLIKDDNLPPLKWELGRVVSTIPGKDGISRVANIRTSRGTIRRTYVKICPLVEPELAR